MLPIKLESKIVLQQEQYKHRVLPVAQLRNVDESLALSVSGFGYNLHEELRSYSLKGSCLIPSNWKLCRI
jgi:hypothetical protein